MHFKKASILVASLLIFGSVTNQVTIVTSETDRDGSGSGSAVAEPARGSLAQTLADGSFLPQITLFQAGSGREEVLGGSLLVVTFNQPMKEVGFTLTPTAKTWEYWNSSKKITIMPRQFFAPQTRYTVTFFGQSVKGTELSGQLSFSFRTSVALAVGPGCPREALMYHINGFPGRGDIVHNFVSWSGFYAQIDTLVNRGCRFVSLNEVGLPDTVALTFDDGWATQYPAALYLARRGLRATFFLTVNNLDRSGYLTRLQVREMVRLGMIIGDHLMDHVCLTNKLYVSLPDRTPENRRKFLDYQMGESQRVLQELSGQPVRELAYPNGCLDAEVIEAASKYFWAAWDTNRETGLTENFSRYNQHRILITDKSGF